MAGQSISLDGADGVSPGAPNANAEGGDPVGDVVAIIGLRITLASARNPETVLNRMKHEALVEAQQAAQIQQPAVEVFHDIPHGLAPWHSGGQALRGERRFRRSTPRLGSGPLPI